MDMNVHRTTYEGLFSGMLHSEIVNIFFSLFLTNCLNKRTLIFHIHYL